MSVTLEGRVIKLAGECRVEEAEPLAVLLQSDPSRAIDLGDCLALHSAVAQALLSFRPPMAVAPQDPFLRDLVFSGYGQPSVAGEG